MQFPGLVAAAWLMLAGVLAPVHAEELLTRSLQNEPAGAAADDVAWRILKETGTAEQLRRFIAESPAGPRRQEAEERLQAMEPATATAPRGAEQADPVQGKPPGGSGEPSNEPAAAPTEALPAQKAILYEEDAANPNGTQFIGTAIWRTERAPLAAGQKPDVSIRGDIEIPDQKVSVRLSLRRNEDKALRASHTVEITFTLPPGFPHVGIGNIPGIMMKEGETTRGSPFEGLAVKVTDNYFLVGLSSADAAVQRNVQLLKERSWFDIPIVYADGKRALLAIEKGPPGERAFAEAFAAWEQTVDVAGAPARGSRPAPVDLPLDVANLPAVIALQLNDPAAFDRFKKRYGDSAVNARKDEEMTLARSALRKSVKHLIANSPDDVLVEITEISLSYLQGLQSTNPETCVWLSDDSKGAKRTSDLANELPIPYVREMSVLERIASTDPHITIAPMTDEDARPYFERLLKVLRRQNVRTDLQARGRLDPSEFAPFCALVIAFYQAVLDMPHDDKINVLRSLYAKAAVNADNDLKR